MRNAVVLAMWISVSALVSIWTCYAQNASVGITDEKSKLATRLAASVDRVRYCRGDNDTYSAQLRLRIQYTNLSSRKALLYKATKPIDVVDAVIGRSVTALQDKQFEATIQYDQFVNPEKISATPKPDPRQFVVINPGESYELIGKVAVAIRRGPNPQLPGTITNGTHVMIARIIDWPFTLDDADRLQKRWASGGALNYQMMETEPFEFSIPLTVRVQKCSEAGGPLKPKGGLSGAVLGGLAHLYDFL